MLDLLYTDDPLLELELEVLSDYKNFICTFSYQPYSYTPLIFDSHSFRELFYDCFADTYYAYLNYVAFTERKRSFSELDEDEQDWVNEAVYGLHGYDDIGTMITQTLYKHNIFYLYEIEVFKNDELFSLIDWENSPLQEVW